MMNNNYGGSLQARTGNGSKTIYFHAPRVFLRLPCLPKSYHAFLFVCSDVMHSNMSCLDITNLLKYHCIFKSSASDIRIPWNELFWIENLLNYFSLAKSLVDGIVGLYIQRERERIFLVVIIFSENMQVTSKRCQAVLIIWYLSIGILWLQAQLPHQAAINYWFISIWRIIERNKRHWELQ